MNSNNWWKTGRRLSRLQWLCSASLVLLLLPTASFSGLGASPSFRPFHSGQSASGLDLSQSPSKLPNLPALNPATFHCYTGCNSTNYCCLLSMMIHGSFTHSKSRDFSGGILVPKKVDRKTIFEEKPFQQPLESHPVGEHHCLFDHMTHIYLRLSQLGPGREQNPGWICSLQSTSTLCEQEQLQCDHGSVEHAGLSESKAAQDCEFHPRLTLVFTWGRKSRGTISKATCMMTIFHKTSHSALQYVLCPAVHPSIPHTVGGDPKI